MSPLTVVLMPPAPLLSGRGVARCPVTHIIRATINANSRTTNTKTSLNFIAITTFYLVVNLPDGLVSVGLTDGPGIKAPVSAWAGRAPAAMSPLYAAAVSTAPSLFSRYHFRRLNRSSESRPASRNSFAVIFSRMSSAVISNTCSCSGVASSTIMYS